MTALFQRDYRVTVDDISITKLDLTFKIVRNLGREPNTAEIAIKNLSPDNRAALEEKEEVRVRVEAGYITAEGVPADEGFAGRSLIYSGDLREAHTERDGADLITTISSGDGEKRQRRARANKTFGPGTRIRTVVEALADALGVGLGNLRDLQDLEFGATGGIFPNGTVISGNAWRELSQIFRSAALEVTIQNGVLQVLPRRTALAGQAVLLKSTTGLIESPSQSSDGTARARCLMIPDLFPGRKVKFEAQRVSGFFRVNKASYTGDTAADDWFIDIECDPLS